MAATAHAETKLETNPAQILDALASVAEMEAETGPQHRRKRHKRSELTAQQRLELHKLMSREEEDEHGKHDTHSSGAVVASSSSVSRRRSL